MGRVALLTYLTEDIAFLGIRSGTKVARDVGRVVAELMDADVLPGPDEAFRLLPPRVAYGPMVGVHGRKVPGHDLWVWYRATDERLEVVTITAAPWAGPIVLSCSA